MDGPTTLNQDPCWPLHRYGSPRGPDTAPSYLSSAVDRVIDLTGTRREDEREREKNLYFSVVTGTHYRTKTPPDQQPTELSQGYDETRCYLQCV